MEKRLYPALGETVVWDTLPNGLTVAVVPKPGFSKKLCYFVTDFGSIHRQFAVDGQAFTVPAGIAHYLEHKLFDMPDRDVAGEFASLGAVPNAFTSYDMTAYYFSCTEHFDRCLALLLEFVSTPYFTKESVEKEQGIIGQEIDMNADNPDTRIFEQLMQAMYRQHPVNEPILGTRDSIAQITPETLYLCHQAFYRPDNMLLCVVGDVDPEQVKRIALERLRAGIGPKPEVRRCWQEEMTCASPCVSRAMAVSMPMFQLGFKSEPADRGVEAVRREIIGDLAAEALFGESSALYLRLYEQGLIDSSFGGGFETVEGMAMLTASGDSEDPEGVRDAVLQEVQALLSRGIGEQALLRMKRSALGRRIRGLDSFDSVCFRICAYYFSGFDYFEFPALYRDVTEEEVLVFIRQTVTRERMSLSVIYPEEDEP